MSDLVKIYSQGVGANLSLLHGWAMNAAVFEPFADRLAAHYQVNRVDLPGYGLSGNASRQDFELQLEQLARALPASTLIGWSMGGLYAIALCRRYPDKFKRLILLASNPCYVDRDDWPSGMPAAVFNEFAESLLANWQGTIRRFIGLQMHGVAGARNLIRDISELLRKGGEPDVAVLRFGLQLLLEQDMRDELSDLAIPVLAILGMRDKLVPASLAQQLPQLNPAIRVECLARSAHAPFLSDSENVEKLIDRFIASSTPG